MVPGRPEGRHEIKDNVEKGRSTGRDDAFIFVERCAGDKLCGLGELAEPALYGAGFLVTVACLEESLIPEHPGWNQCLGMLSDFIQNGFDLIKGPAS